MTLAETRPLRDGGALIAMLVALAAGLPAAAQAQSYPDKPIKLIVPGAAGGPTDVTARLAAQFLPRLGQPTVVENRRGAGGALGARFVAAAAADGYTLLVGNTSVLAVIPAVSASAGYDPTTSFAPVAKFSESFQLLVVHPSSPWTSLAALVHDAKAHPGKINYAHTGAGGLPHLAGELLGSRAGIDMVGVPYRSGSESVTAVLTEAVHMTFESITILLPLVREGRLRALAVTSRTRTALAPDLPTMIEAGAPDYEVSTFNGFVAPAGTPGDIVGRLNAAINEGTSEPDMREKIARLGAVATPGTPEQFGAFMAAELTKWRTVAQAAHVRID